MLGYIILNISITAIFLCLDSRRKEKQKFLITSQEFMEI